MAIPVRREENGTAKKEVIVFKMRQPVEILFLLCVILSFCSFFRANITISTHILSQDHPSQGASSDAPYYTTTTNSVKQFLTSGILYDSHSSSLRTGQHSKEVASIVHNYAAKHEANEKQARQNTEAKIAASWKYLSAEAKQIAKQEAIQRAAEAHRKELAKARQKADSKEVASIINNIVSKHEAHEKEEKRKAEAKIAARSKSYQKHVAAEDKQIAETEARQKADEAKQIEEAKARQKDHAREVASMMLKFAAQHEAEEAFRNDPAQIAKAKAEAKKKAIAEEAAALKSKLAAEAKAKKEKAKLDAAIKEAEATARINSQAAATAAAEAEEASAIAAKAKAAAEKKAAPCKRKECPLNQRIKLVEALKDVRFRETNAAKAKEEAEETRKAADASSVALKKLLRKRAAL